MIGEKALTDPPGTVIRIKHETNPMLTRRPHNYRLAAAAKASNLVPSGRWFARGLECQGQISSFVEGFEMTAKIGLDSGTGGLL